MATVERILAQKGHHVYSISPKATVLDAAMLMNEHRIGALVVQEQGEIEGIITERDLLQRVMGKGHDPARTLVSDVMTRNMLVCRPDTTVEEVRNIFMSQRIRHLPVLDERGRLRGLISIGDINAHLISGQTQEIHYLYEYIQQRF